jgi:hypothetical protein
MHTLCVIANLGKKVHGILASMVVAELQTLNNRGLLEV